MRTDRRGPLLAFIVIAIVAGVLLITSVRSHAATPLHAPHGHAVGSR